MAKKLTLAILVTVAACGSDPSGSGPDAELVALDLCLAGGGDLGAITEIDNNVLTEHGEIVAMDFAPTGQMALASTDGAIKLWSIRDATELTIAPDLDYDAAFGENSAPVRSLAYRPDGSWIAAGRMSGEVSTWDPTTGEELASASVTDRPVRSVDVAPDGERVAIAYENTEVREWVPGQEPGAVLPTDLWDVAVVRYLPDGRLATAGHWYNQPEIEIRSASDPAVIEDGWADEVHSGWIHDVTMSPDGGTLVAAGDRLLVLLDLAGEREPQVIDVDANLMAIALSPGGEHAFATDDGGRVHTFAIADGAELGAMDTADVVSLRSEQGYEQLIAAHRDGMVRVLACE